MKKITFNEYITTQDSGLFTEMNKIKPFEWNDVYTPEQLDILFLFKHGDKPMLKSLNGISLDTLAKIVYTSFSVKWSKIYEATALDTPINQMYKITTDEHIESNDEMTVLGETSDKESAFNSEDLVIGSGSENNVVTGDKVDRNRTNEQTRIDNQTMVDNLQRLEDFLFTDVVLKDTSDLINLKIYN